jgi:FlaA1/EpsC-like NDP-sugar epimerase
MYEELLIAGENVLPTSHEKIRVMAAVMFDTAAFEVELERLFTAAGRNDIVGVVEGLRSLVPEYIPTHHFNGNVPDRFRRMRPDVQCELTV